MEEIKSKINSKLERTVDRLDDLFKCYEDRLRIFQYWRGTNHDIEIPNKYSSSDIEQFSFALRGYQEREQFSATGLFLSKLINESPDREFVIHTKHLDSLIDYIGYENNGKSICVNGDAGGDIGSNMKGGKIIVKGDVKSCIGRKMHGGDITINGNAEEYLGIKMNGGNISILGNASYNVGFRMNKGVIKIKENTGHNTGCEMVGGSIIINGNAGASLGESMMGGNIHLDGEFYDLAVRIYGGNIFYKGNQIVRN